MAPITEDVKSEKKHKKDKSSKSEKKRAREEDGLADTERKHKKSKSSATAAITEAPLEVDNHADVKPEKKKKKKKEKKTEDGEAEPAQNGEAPADVKAEKKHKKKKESHDEPQDTANTEDGSKKKKKKDKSSKKHRQETETEPQEPEPEPVTIPATNPEDAMDIDVPAKPKSSHIHQPSDIPANPQFPFFSQTVSLYEPIYPIGFAQPVTSCQSQHLRHLQNRYVPSLRGVLMDYRNVALGEYPGRQDAATDDDMSTTLLSKAEAAVGYGWITADVDLFVPSRGAWMEGSVNLQTEGHIGVVCFGKFNASIEARRLPPGWKWVPNEAPEAQGFEETASVITADDHGVVRQIHSTGFWADERGDKVKGKIRFRIRNFDVGSSGDTSYLSLEGTMLDKAGEKKLVAEEASLAKMRKAKRSGGLNRERRHVPEFSMTRFNAEDEEQTAQDVDEKAEILRSE